MYTGPGEPPRVRPPLTKRLTRRDWIRLDCLAALGAVVIMLVGGLAATGAQARIRVPCSSSGCCSPRRGVSRSRSSACIPSRRRAAAIALVCSVGLIVAEAALTRLAGSVSLALILIIFWGFGTAVRQRRAYANGLQHQAASRDALDEMRRMLSVLRQADAAGDAPVAGPEDGRLALADLAADAPGEPSGAAGVPSQGR